MNKLIILGAGGHGKSAADIAELMGYTDIAFLDDNLEVSSKVIGIEVIGKISEFKKYINEADFFIGIGNADIRKKLYDDVSACGATIVNLIHPNSTIAKSASVGKGVYLSVGSVVGADAVVGDGAIVNTLATVNHDCRLGNFSHISAGVHMVGGTQIEDFTFVGVGGIIIHNVCSNCLIGAGTVVAKPITESGTYVGVPARKIK